MGKTVGGVKFERSLDGSFLAVRDTFPDWIEEIEVKEDLQNNGFWTWRVSLIAQHLPASIFENLNGSEFGRDAAMRAALKAFGAFIKDVHALSAHFKELAK